MADFHTAIKITPFEALYGYTPPHLPMGYIPKSSNQAVTDLIIGRQQAMKELKFHLTRAQVKMKKYADQHRTERHFSVADRVYLKLQPYRQISTKSKKVNHKLGPRFYGPFEVLAKIGKVVYQLNLPIRSQIHPVFHVSQLKKKVGLGTSLLTKLPLIGPQGTTLLNPIAILDRRAVKKNNAVAVEILVEWANLPVEEATWEDYHFI
jgi:hypothetical protein